MSFNGGTSWKRCLSKGLYQNNAGSIAVDPVNHLCVFALESRLWYHHDKEFDGLYKSTDGGDNWTLILQKEVGVDWYKHRYIARNIAFDRSTMGGTETTTLYVALHYRTGANWDANDGGLYKSTDGGDNWTQLVNSTIDKYYQIAVGDGVVYLATDEGLESYTSGDSYSSLGDLPEGVVTSVFVHPLDSTIVFATIYEDGLYKSTNSGANFVELKDFDVQAGFYNPGYPDTIYLVGIWKGTSTVVTHDGGETWHKNEDCHNIPEGIYSARIYGPSAGVVPNAKDPDEAVAFGNANIYKTVNGGVTFNESATLFTGYSVVFQGSYAFDQFDSDRFALGLADVGYTVTTNGGDWFYKNWNTSDEGIVPDWGTAKYIPYANTIYCPFVDFKPVRDSEIMAATVGYSPVNVGRTRRMYLASEATGWALETSYEPNNPPDGWDPYPWDLYLQYHYIDANIVYTSQSKSTDGGVSYQAIDFSGFDEYGTPFVWGQCLAYPDVIYATCQYNQVVLRSDDKGETWTKITQPGWKFNIFTVLPAFAIDPEDPNLFYSIDADKDIAKCEKVEDTWTWTSLGLLPQVSRPGTMYSYVSKIAIDPQHPNIIYAVVAGAGISNTWRSIDSGTTWQDISYNLPRNGGFVIGVSPHTGELLAGGLTGTYVLPPPYESTSLIYNKCVPISPSSQGTKHAPVLASIGNKSVNENSLLTFTVTATDADGDAITYSIQNKPSGATFVNRTFSWTPSYAQANSYQVTFRATDGKTWDSETITIAVNNVNRAPVLGSIVDQSIDENSTLSFSVSATDPDGDTITYSLEPLPTGAVFGSQTFTWTPGYDQAGIYDVNFIARDGQDQDSETITITVINVNRPPGLSAIGNKSIYAGDLLTFTVNATDIDGDTIIYSASNLPFGANFDAVTQTFTWTPSESQVGSHDDVRFIAADSQDQTVEPITITVTADTSAPSVANCAPAVDSIQAPLNTLVTLHVVDDGKGVDPDSVKINVNDNLVYSDNTATHSSAYGECHRIGTKADYTFIYQPKQNFEFDETVRVKVNARDLAGNPMEEYSYSFKTEMLSFGKNKRVDLRDVKKGRPVTVCDNSGNIWAAWHAGVTDSRDIYIGKLEDGAVNFDSSIQLTSDAAECNPVTA
ncbi:MAG: hypothetical protein KAV87_32220, partial [Desulfobacteraceae bacterium]|nr:hypothetical protein [Desulfobacteraceae bacterium]